MPSRFFVNDMIEPNENEIKELAYHFWEMRNGGNGFSEIDWLHAERQLRVEKNYDCVAAKNFDQAEHLRDNPYEDELSCRYCGLNENQTTFNSEGHAISSHWGSNLISLDECDVCNGIFGKCESTFGQLTAPIRACMRTIHTRKGRRSVPSNDIVVGPDGTKRFKDVDEQGEKWVGLNYSAVKTTEAKIKVAKALVKYGLAIMPSELIESFRPTIDWVLSQDHSYVPPECKNWMVLISATPSEQGHWYEDQSQIQLYVLKEDDQKLNGTILLFRQASMALQISIPLSSDARLRCKTNTLFVPAFSRFDQKFEAPQHPQVDKELSLVDPKLLTSMQI